MDPETLNRVGQLSNEKLVSPSIPTTQVTKVINASIEKLFGGNALIFATYKTVNLGKRRHVRLIKLLLASLLNYYMVIEPVFLDNLPPGSPISWCKCSLIENITKYSTIKFVQEIPVCCSY